MPTFNSFSELKTYLNFPHIHAQICVENHLKQIIEKYDNESALCTAHAPKLIEPLRINHRIKSLLKKAMLLLPPIKRYHQHFAELQALNSHHQNKKMIHEVVWFCDVCNQVMCSDLATYPFPEANSLTSRIIRFREWFICSNCHLSNRQRLAMWISLDYLESIQNPKIYVQEPVGPFYQYLKERFPDLVGSEYFGENYMPGELVNGIRHEDCMHLSFEDESINMIISNDIFEHIPDVELAFKESYRVLTHGGAMALSIPFNVSNTSTFKRASIENGCVIHHAAPIYHGSLLASEGALVYYDFGHDILDMLDKIGFVTNIILSDELIYGHYSRPIQFLLIKPTKL